MYVFFFFAYFKTTVDYSCQLYFHLLEWKVCVWVMNIKKGWEKSGKNKNINYIKYYDYAVWFYDLSIYLSI